MAISPGTRLGPYEIIAAIGAGGMGEVYRARDPDLNRDVAIKVLPDGVARDSERLARFQREARVLASLNHPNIAHIHGLQRTDDGTTALIMELVEGEDLSQRLARAGPIPLDEATPIASQIAEALEAAHEQGIVHRDLKPANIKVREDGTVKVLDFGLAKAMEPAGAMSAGASTSPTITSPAMTHAGMILGTAAYMSPEQAAGRPVDKRADIWSFGVVLWEMLTGRRLFDGDTVSHTLAEVLRAPIDFGQLPRDTPPTIRMLLRRCLNRDARKRLRDIGEARFQLDEASSGAREDTASDASTLLSTTRARWRERVAWGTAAALALLGAGAIVWALRPVAAPPETRLEIVTPATEDPISFAISPDGLRLVFVASATGGGSQLWLRPMDQTAAQPLPGTEGATYPFWSPDSQSVAFFSGNQLKRLDIGSGSPRTLASTGSGGYGGSWSADGEIVFGRSSGALIRVPASATGGVPVTATTVAEGQTGHRFPHFLPGSRQFLFHSRGASAGLYLGSLDSPAIRRIASADTSAMFMAPHWVAFLRQRTLLVQRFDPTRGELAGEPVSIADQVAFDSTSVAGAFSVSRTGLILYRTGNAALTQLTWFDRNGTSLGTIGPPEANGLLQPVLSPDGRRVLGHRSVENNTDIWLSDATRMIKLTFDASRDMYAVWSPDGSRIAFTKAPGAKGMQDLYQKSAGGGGREELLLAAPPSGLAPMSWSSDGRFLMYIERNSETAGDLSYLPLDGKQKPSVFLKSKYEERTAQFSPDVRWVAYASDESGRLEIYVRSFPAGGDRAQVSTAGGVTPRWRRDGKELYYIAPDAKLMAVPVAVKNGVLDIAPPVALFQTRILYGGTSPVGSNWQFDIAPDGRFLINVNTGKGDRPPITIIHNWIPKN